MIPGMWERIGIETVATGLGWGEGPVALASAGGIVFSDVAGDAMWLWQAATGAVKPFRRPSAHANGNTVDREGRLVTCEHRTRRVTRTEGDGRTTVLAESFAGGRLNSPNDVVVARDGTVWFTDPPYGLLRGECGDDARREQERDGVFRVDPRDGRVERMIDLLDKPNGLAFSPDERVLYVSDTGYSHRPGGNHHVFRFEVENGRIGSLTVFKAIEPGACDGLRVDRDGNVWCTAGDGVQCFAAEGSPLGAIGLGEMATNLCFLESEGRGLFVTTPSRALVCRFAGRPASDGFCRGAAA